ncbi:MAG: 3-hydroxyacyl-CoA dehydrogenase [Alphaproteobacteria bacterium]|nr:3-hydroxyacyl-CoA dehydrogenase [Alphaproteobacteria bacterium]
MPEAVGYAVADGIAVLTIDNPPVNALGHAVREGLLAEVERAAADPAVAGLVLIGAGRTFPAGANIREFDTPRLDPHLSVIINMLDAMAKPAVAAIHGTALGGGLELSLGCHFRVAAPTARMGTPEVKLGIFPGAAGTQRLPRIVGLDRALQLVVLGDPIDAGTARDWGLVDAIVDGDLRAGALAFARRAVTERLPLRHSSEPRAGLGRPEDFKETIDKWRATAARRFRGQESPIEALESVLDGLRMPYDEALAADRRRFEKRRDSQQSKALRYAFFAEREVAKVPGVDRDTPVRPLATAGVVGAGTMGRGIAIALIDAGLPVTMVDTSGPALAAAVEMMNAHWDGQAARGRIDADEAARRKARLATAMDIAALGTADLVIEAAFEEMGVKRDIFARLDRVAKAGALLATNTSYLDIDHIAAATARPGDVLGLHFFVPANLMRLLEIVQAGKTSAEAMATAFALASRMGKTGAMARNGFGFVANASRAPMVREANFLVEEGAEPAQIDGAIERFGMPLGPLATSDLSGLDVSWRMRRDTAATRDQSLRYVHIADAMVDAGRLGRKVGKGWYLYPEGSQRVPDAEVTVLARKVAAAHGVPRRAIDDAEIVDRCLYAAVNEGARLLGLGRALRASDIDIMWQYGFGFPAWRGGIMFHADSVGLDTVLARVEEFHARHGRLWEPAPLLVRLARENGKFTV